MNEETRKLRFYLRSGKSVPPRRVYCYAIESVSRYEPQGDFPILRKRTTHTSGVRRRRTNEPLSTA